MTSAPADLLVFRADIRAVTGLGAAEVGIVGDGAHQRTGGYHEARDVLVMIGRYHPSAAAGAASEDYSVRQARDRRGLTSNASATDIGSAWRNGGRVAWLRFNNLLYREMVDHPERLPALRAINVSLDGRKKSRYDQLHRDQGLIVSADTVDTHTHLSFWRDTEGNRQATLDRIVQLARAAVANAPAPSTPTGGVTELSVPDAVINNTHDRVWALYNSMIPALQAQLTASAAADEARDKAATAAINALAAALQAGGGSIDAAPIVAAVNAVRDEARAQFAAAAEQAAEQDSRIADLQEQLARAVAAAEANLSAAELDKLRK